MQCQLHRLAKCLSVKLVLHLLGIRGTILFATTIDDGSVSGTNDNNLISILQIHTYKAN